MGLARRIVENVAADLGIKLKNQTATGNISASMNDESFTEWLGISKKKKGVMSEITYFTC